MIPRYSRPEMSRIWSPENRYRIWFEIEAHACDAHAALGIIPESAARAVWERGAFEVERIDEIERETRHDVIAFLTNLAEHVGRAARCRAQIHADDRAQPRHPCGADHLRPQARRTLRGVRPQSGAAPRRPRG